MPDNMLYTIWIFHKSPYIVKIIHIRILRNKKTDTEVIQTVQMLLISEIIGSFSANSLRKRLKN